ncbi:chemotaxis protein CheA [Kushneria phosphatilytica]|uniref:Chemotaxis protein CheA n=1 Tax=Kushneria phosphatilytica TaxID=657387 RepID=A0A1S1NXS2_9GAMM|nr:chemotaxis protein CheA [Kushneria phosphatilytica]OHV12360.1 chemotaxis protein CheA [Kushneria phosphatilytica]QEL12801.1 chemotaxis protein CheA [Kushneria phosphatilytica]
MDITEFYQTFFEEAAELLAEMEQQLLALDPDEPDTEQLHAIFRAAHSIKGGAGTFGFTVLQETTHLLENLLDRARHGELQLDRATIDIFLETKDMLSDQLEAYRQQTEPDAEAFDRICQVLKTLAEEGSEQAAAAASAESESTLSSDPSPSSQDASHDAGGLRLILKGVPAESAEALVEELALFGEISEQVRDGDNLKISLATQNSADDVRAVLGFVLNDDQIDIQPFQAIAAPEENETKADEPAASEQKAAVSAETQPAKATGSGEAGGKSAEKPRPAPRAGASESSSLRVSIEKIDQIINLVGELVITQSMLEQGASELDPVVHGKLMSGMNQLQRNARDLQESVMSVRMMPMDYVFSRFPRLVRDLAAKLGKEVELETVGKSTELDKSLIERIIDPLTHLVRNSLDHGIESPEKRVAAGKPKAGKLTLAAQHQGGNILIEISDDGAGLNRERILAKAAQNGLSVSESMSDDDVWQLIFAPGFSTADQVTDVSGRGVGMDVVKRNIQQMGGHVDILSNPGQGTSIRIVLPLTLAILDGMSVRVGEEIYILPLSAIMESMQVSEDHINTVTGSERLLFVRGEYLPLVELHRVFDIPDAEQDVTRGIVIIVQSEGRHFGLLVDQLIGQHQVVVKNLETNYRKVNGVSAATILGDGSVALILDIPALSRTTRDREKARQQAKVNRGETA